MNHQYRKDKIASIKNSIEKCSDTYSLYIEDKLGHNYLLLTSTIYELVNISYPISFSDEKEINDEIEREIKSGFRHTIESYHSDFSSSSLKQDFDNFNSDLDGLDIQWQVRADNVLDAYKSGWIHKEISTCITKIVKKIAIKSAQHADEQTWQVISLGTPDTSITIFDVIEWAISKKLERLHHVRH